MKLLVFGHPLVVRENRLVFEALASDEHMDVAVIAPKHLKDDRYGDQAELITAAEQDHRYRVIPSEFRSGRTWAYPGIIRHLTSFQPDVVFGIGEWNWFSIVNVLLASKAVLRSRPVTISCTLQNIAYQVPRLRSRFREACGCLAADIILASCQDAADILRQHGFRGRIAVEYPLGAVAVPEAAPDHQGKGSAFVVGFVGRLAAEKGVFDLVDAVAQLPADSRLLFVGDGPDRPALENRCAELGLRGRCDFAGFISRQHVAEYYKRMSVLVLPTRTQPEFKEQFGVVLAEAMAMGTPVIGSTCGAIPEVIGDAGHIFAEGDIAALATLLATLRNTPSKLLEMSRAGFARASYKFAAGAIASRIAQLLRDSHSSRTAHPRASNA